MKEMRCMKEYQLEKPSWPGIGVRGGRLLSRAPRFNITGIRDSGSAIQYYGDSGFWSRNPISREWQDCWEASKLLGGFVELMMRPRRAGFQNAVAPCSATVSIARHELREASGPTKSPPSLYNSGSRSSRARASFTDLLSPFLRIPSLKSPSLFLACLFLL